MYVRKGLRSPADAEEQRHAGIVIGHGWGKRDVMEIDHEGGGEGNAGTDLIFQRHAERNEVTGVVAIDFGWVAAAVKIGMDQSKSCAWRDD